MTIPSQIASVEGEFAEVDLTEDGILLRHQKMIDATQSWFWTPSWQARERAAEEDRAAGRSEPLYE